MERCQYKRYVKEKKEKKKKTFKKQNVCCNEKRKTIDIIKTVTNLNIKLKKCLSKLYFDGRTMALFFTAPSLQEVFSFLF